MKEVYIVEFPHKKILIMLLKHSIGYAKHKEDLVQRCRGMSITRNLFREKFIRFPINDSYFSELNLVFVNYALERTEKRVSRFSRSLHIQFKKPYTPDIQTIIMSNTISMYLFCKRNSI